MEKFIKKLIGFFKHTFLTLLASACLALAISYGFSLYWNRPIDNIQSHIIDEYFDGNQLSHDSAVKHKLVRYCTKYVAIIPGGSFHPPTSYVSSRSGRFYCKHWFRQTVGDGRGGIHCPPKDIGNCKNFCWTLECALRLNDFDWISEFIKDGGDINAVFGKQTSFGEEYIKRTPLHYATSRCRNDLMEFLINHGAQLNARDEYGHTPLYLVVAKNPCYFNSDRVLVLAKVLIENGADTKLKYGEKQLTLRAWITNKMNMQPKHTLNKAWGSLLQML